VKKLIWAATVSLFALAASAWAQAPTSQVLVPGLGNAGAISDTDLSVLYQGSSPLLNVAQSVLKIYFQAGLATSGANSNITSLSGLTTALSVLQGGIGVNTLTSGGLVLAHGISPFTALAEVDGDCVLGAGGAWTAGACGGTATIIINSTPITGSSSGNALVSDGSKLQQLPYGPTGNSTLVETTSGGLLTPSILPLATSAALGGVKSDGGLTTQLAAGVMSTVAPVPTTTVYQVTTSSVALPTGTRYMRVIVQGQGGCGGGGAGITTPFTGAGGGAGGGGDVKDTGWFLSSNVSGNYTVTIGTSCTAAGGGGVGANGTSGSVGANATFAMTGLPSNIVAYGGGGGAGAVGGAGATATGGGGGGGTIQVGASSTTATGAAGGLVGGGAGGSGVAASSTAPLYESGGGGGGTGTTGTATGGATSPGGAAGGGSGGGCNTGTPAIGGTGAMSFSASVTAGGTVGGGTPSNGPAAFGGWGAGGGAGGAGSTTTGANGSNGGAGGGGGGGAGSGCGASATGGNGGVGGAAMITVMTQ
jgi:hypothetical protein